FLAVLLVLTFFSNTIMNASLPEVATQQVTQGTINAKIRASGTITANETYNVKLAQSRKIESVKCKVGQAVNAGDVLFVLEAQESDELKAAKTDLEAKELDYQKSLINASNDSAQEDRDVQKLRDAYNEALAIYSQYSSMDASQIATAKAKADAKKKELDRAKKDADEALAEAQADEDYTTAKANIATLEAQIASFETEIDGYKEQIKELQTTGGNTTGGPRDAIEKRQIQLNKLLADNAIYTSDYDEADELLSGNAATEENLANALMNKKGYTQAEAVQRAAELKIAYDQWTKYLTDKAQLEEEIRDLEKQLDNTETPISTQEQIDKLNEKINTANAKLKKANRDLTSTKNTVESQENLIKRLKAHADELAEQVEDQADVISDLESASTAAETVKTAKTALEDKLFEMNKGDTAALDMQAAKKAIEEAKANIEKLTKDADAQEVTAKVGGTIASVGVTAGDTASADTAIATINQTDRGFTVKISITNEQAKKVKVGDTAELVNYWGDATATLETIGNDPQNPQKNRQLTFRLTGSDIQPDSNITLAIGQQSASYDAIVPTSAIRTDNNGSFVLAIVSKSTPLSTRYTATRVDVQVLASDDKSSAVSGIGSGEFVITTSTKPIEAGTQVRLAENG
ncbi:MAG: HlyD family efflux transporter periplasmic adaptor subunit, partial [Clostridiales bacterium]|nr:HlyD family efflux transporter periplasmic adaptor subunit [Clostridiales bacterium]